MGATVVGTRTTRVTSTPMLPAHLQALYANQGMSLPVPDGSRAVTLWRDGHPLACFGVIVLWPRVGLAWMEDAGVDAMARDRLAIGRALLTAWHGWVEGGAFRRIDCLVPEVHAHAQRLVHHLGFQLVLRQPWHGADGGTTLHYVWYPPGVVVKEARLWEVA